MTTAQPAPRAAWPEGCSWLAPAVAARRRRPRVHRTASPGHPTRPGGPWRTGTGSAVSPCSECGVERHESSVARPAPTRGRPSGCCGQKSLSTGTNSAAAPQCSRPASADWRTTEGTPDPQRTSSSPVPVETRLSHLSSACRRTCFTSPGGTARPRTAPRRTTGHRQRPTGGGPRRPPIETGPHPAAVPGPSTGHPGADPWRRRMQGLHRWQVTRQRRPLQENNRRQSEKAGCEVSPPGPKWRLLW